METYIIIIKEPKPRRGHYIIKGVISANSPEAARYIALVQSRSNPNAKFEVTPLSPGKFHIIARG